MFLSLLKFLSLIIKTLKSTSNPVNIAFGCAFGVVFAITPFNWTGFLCAVVIFTLFDISIAAGFLGAGIGALIGLFTDPLADILGKYILNNISEGSTLYDVFSSSLVQMLDLTYSIVLGQSIIGLLLFAPVVIGCKRFIYYYRDSLEEKIVNHPAFKVISLSKFGRWVLSIYTKLQ